MRSYLRHVDKFANDYHLSPADRLKLKLRAPIVKVHWYANYGSPRMKALGAALSPYLNHQIRLRVKKCGKVSDIPISFERSDFASCTEVLLCGAYSLPIDLSTIRTMVDLGANTGMASLYFCLNCENLEELLLVEANPKLRAKLEHNLREQIKRRSIEILQACVSNDPASEVTFHVSDDHRMSYKDTGNVPGRLVPITVKNVRLSELLDSRGLKEVDILKMDIEGSEFDVLEDRDVLRRFRCIVAEVHGEAPLRERFAGRLRDLGFRLPEDHKHKPGDPCELLWAIRPDSAADECQDDESLASAA